MSAATATVSDDCRHCGGAIPEDAADPNDTYCSRECYYRHRGENVLEDIQRDHRICATCFTRIKTVEYADVIRSRQPKVDIRQVPECVIGYQYPTEHTTVGQDEFATLDHDAVRIEGTRWSCGNCGTVDPNEAHPDLRSLDEGKTARRLYEAVDELADRDAIPNAPDHERFIEGWRDGGAALAVGKAVFGD